VSSMRIDDLLLWAADRLDIGRSIALCLLVNTKGSTPASTGAIMIVDDTAQTVGTIGGGCVEAEIRRKAVSAISTKTNEVHSIVLDHDYGYDDGLICGGRIWVAVNTTPDKNKLREIAEKHRTRQPTKLTITAIDENNQPTQYTLDLPPRPRLLIAGAGHIGQAVAQLALNLDYDIAVVDDRADLLEKHFPDEIEKLPGPIDKQLINQPLDKQTSIIIVTRGHRHDEQALKAVVDSNAGYIGMIGSRRKIQLIYKNLTELGIDQQKLDKVHAPIGLDINAVTVNEIAISIMAQLISIRRKDWKPPISGWHGSGGVLGA